MRASDDNEDLRSIAGLYTVGRKLGNGTFGEVRLAVKNGTGEKVAVKLESIRGKHPMLMHEAKILSHLQGMQGVTNLHYSGIEDGYYVMVMDLLGPSLEELFGALGRCFSLKTVLMIADQLLYRIEQLHAKSYIHRDLKPENVLVGQKHGDGSNKIYVIDFGLSKRYRDSKKQHIPYREGKSLTGTARYASINTHLGCEQSRRDDLEAIGYMLIYFLRGSLPWQGIEAPTKEERYAKILECKQATPVEHFCREYPPAFGSYLNYCRSLRFDDQPDYAYLRRLFKDVFFRHHLGQHYLHFDWCPGQDSSGESSQKPALQESEGRLPRKSTLTAEADSCAGCTLRSCADLSSVGKTPSTPSTAAPSSSRQWSLSGSKLSLQAAGNGSKVANHKKETSQGLISRMASLFACGYASSMKL